MNFLQTAPETTTLHSLADVERFERTPWRQRVPLADTYHLLRRACEWYGDKPALRLLTAAHADARSIDITYRDLLDRIHRTANALATTGLTPQQSVGILLPNIIETHLALWGAQTAAIAAPINPMLDPDYIARICDNEATQVLIAFGPSPDTDIWQKAVAVADRVQSIHTILQVDPSAALGMRLTPSAVDPMGPLPNRKGVRVVDFHAALAVEPGTHLRLTRQFAPGDPCAYFHTGGTTGYPKVAVHRHENQAYLASVLRAIFGEGHVILSGLPLFHVNGALVTGLSAFCSGAEVVMLTPGGYRTPGLLDQFWAIARRFGATTFSAVPTILAALASRPLPEGGVPALRYALCGAAPLPLQVAAAFERVAGVPVLEGYGLTEGTCVSTFNLPGSTPQRGSVGVRLPYQEIGLFAVGTDSKVIRRAAPGEVGVIGIRGPNVFAGYLQPEGTKGIWLDEGWLNTGDLGRLDGEGRLTVCGRAKDLIIRGGHNIDPAMIEDALMRHPAVALAGAVGQPDAHAGELPVAYVSLRPNANATAEELLAHARAAVPERAAVPVRIQVVPELPLTAVGKVAKPQLRLDAAAHVLRSSLTMEGFGDVRVSPRLCPERGMIVELEGPNAARDAALAIAGRYPIASVWLCHSS